MNKFGYAESLWQKAKGEARTILIQVASRRGRIPYSELTTQIQSIQFEPEDSRFWHLLGEISIEEHEQGRGMLSAIVVHKYGDMIPGSGFFALAQSLGKKSRAQVESLWLAEFNKVHDTWANMKCQPQQAPQLKRPSKVLPHDT